MMLAEIPYWGETAIKVLVAAIVVPTTAFIFGYVFLMKMMSFMQSRRGPMEAGPFGALHLLADGVKFLQKEDIIPEKADRWVFLAAHFVVLMSTAPLSPSIPRAWPVVALLVITTAFRFDAMKAGSQGSWSPDRWASTRIAAEARLISDALPAIAHRPVIATLAPLHAWYAGATVPTVFASGAFMYRIAGLLSPQEQADYETTSARSLGELLDATRPDALYVGHEGDLDRAFVGYAQARRMRPVRIGKRGILYVRPRRRAAEP